MRTVTETFEVFTFSEASTELRDKIRDNINYNWDLYNHYMHERIETLKAVADYLNCSLDYSISCVPSRGEYITMEYKFYNNDEFEETLEALVNIKDDCPFTGVYYDAELIDMIKLQGTSEGGLKAALNCYIDSIHSEYEHMLTDEYLIDFCNANDYEFTLDGKLY